MSGLLRRGLAIALCILPTLSCGAAQEEVEVAPQSLKPCPRTIDEAYVPRSERDGGVSPVAASSASTTQDIVAATKTNPKKAPPPSTRVRTPWKPVVRAENAPIDPKCGGRDNPCPLQKWMRVTMAPALAAKDAPALARALERTATFSPDAAWQWAAISKTAAEAAKKGDIEGARKSCQGCHTIYKTPYKEKFRGRPAK